MDWISTGGGGKDRISLVKEKKNARAILEARRDASRDAPELMHGADLGEDVRESLLGGIVRDVPYEHLVRRSWSAHLAERR